MTTQTDSDVASHTLKWMRRIDEKFDRTEAKLDRVIDVLLRHETRLGRIERDLNEVKSDQVLLENRLLNQMNEILAATRRVDELASKIEDRFPPRPTDDPAS